MNCSIDGEVILQQNGETLTYAVYRHYMEKHRDIMLILVHLEFQNPESDLR